MSTPIVPSDAPHAVKYHRPTETYRVLNAAGIIVDRYQHDSGDFSGRRAMYRLALEDAAVRDAAAARAEARAWADEQAAASAMDAALDLTCSCQLCGGAVMPEDAALVLGERLACGWCAGKAQGIARFVARHGHAPGEPTPAAPSLMDAFTMSDEAWSAAIARYAPTPRRSFIAHELPAFVEELRGLLAYLPDGGVWQSANGDIRLVQAPTRYAAALAGKAK